MICFYQLPSGRGRARRYFACCCTCMGTGRVSWPITWSGCETDHANKVARSVCDANTIHFCAHWRPANDRAHQLWPSCPRVSSMCPRLEAGPRRARSQPWLSPQPANVPERPICTHLLRGLNIQLRSWRCGSPVSVLHALPCVASCIHPQVLPMNANIAHGSQRVRRTSSLQPCTLESQKTLSLQSRSQQIVLRPLIKLVAHTILLHAPRAQAPA